MQSRTLFRHGAAALRRLFGLCAFALLAAGPAHAVAAPGEGPVVTSVLDVDRPLRPGEYLWEPEGAPAGPLEIVVDLTAEQMYVYRGGSEIGRSLIIHGNDGMETPVGSFPILEKDIDHVSNIYHAPMPYMLRLTWGGVAIHGSGESVDGRYATHGCIGLPDEFAALLFKVARRGDRVTVTRNWMPGVYGRWR
ncbi:MAG: L,D-transpeptidase family protein [Pseudomonadota bacterium]